VEVLDANRQVVRQFTQSLSFRIDDGHPNRTEEQKHHVAEAVPLALAYDALLSRLRLTQGQESANLTRLLVHVERYLRDFPDATCTVYQMSRGHQRQRSVKDGRLINLFQGRNPRTGVATYPGDSEIRAATGLTIQVHTLKVTDGDERGPVL